MARLLLHIGYPKAGSTTLQKGILKNLDEEGYINYITVPDSIIFYKNLVLNENFNEKKFSDQKLNVISDEILTTPKYYLRQKFSDLAEQEKIFDPILFPEKINESIGDLFDEVDILTTTRNQPNLVFSEYVQMYRFHAYDGATCNWNGYLSEFFDKTELNSVYDFHTVLKKYSTVFGRKNLHILPLEKLKTSPGEYIKIIRNVLGIDDEITELISTKEYNSSRKSDDYYFRWYWKKKAKFNLPFPLLGSYTIPDLVNAMAPRINSNGRIFKLIMGFFHKFTMEEAQIKKSTQTQENRLLEFYSSGNRKMVDKFGLDMDEFEDYGYIGRI